VQLSYYLRNISKKSISKKLDFENILFVTLDRDNFILMAKERG
jgi:hypothetical protein